MGFLIQLVGGWPVFFKYLIWTPAEPVTHCISKKPRLSGAPSEASVYRSRAVNREIRERAPRAVP